MPNQYKNKVVYGDSVLMDITDTTAEAGDVASGAVFYAKNGARTVGTFTQAQSDWTEDDTTDPAFILNKPPIIAGDGENSTVENSFEISSAGPTVYTLLITGAANSTDFTFTTNDTLPAQSFMKNYGFADYTKSDSSHVYATITSFNKTNGTISFSNALDTSAISGRTLKIYYAYHKAFGKNSHAEGQLSNASGFASHAEGTFSHAIGHSAHAEGGSSLAIGDYTHAEGHQTRAKGEYSHVEGYQTRAESDYQHVQGKYNIEDANDVYADIVGNGTSSARSNAYTLDWSGNGWFAGKVTVGAAPVNNMDVATKQYVDAATPTKALLVNFTYVSRDSQTGYVTYTADKTFGELFNCLYSGGVVYAFAQDDIISHYYMAKDYGGEGIDFYRINFSGEYITQYNIFYSSEGVISGHDDYSMVPLASSSTPLVDGTAAVGFSDDYARADHVHPKITQTISMSNNVITLTGSDGSTSSVTLPVYDGGVTGVTGATGGSS